MKLNLVGAFIRNAPFGTEIAFEKGLRELGMEVRTLDPSVRDMSNQKIWHDPDVTVIWKWLDENQRSWMYKLDGGIRVLYQPDDLNFPHIQEMMKGMRSVCDYALVFNKDGARHAKSFGYKDACPLIVTANPDLYRPLGLKRDIDVSFVGSLSAGDNHRSRMRMLEIVNERFPNASKVFKMTHDVHEINTIYNRSKVVLNHATDVGQSFGTGYGYQCRHFEVGMAGAALLSNEVIDENRIKSFTNFLDEKHFVQQLAVLLKNDTIRADLADRYNEEIMRFHNPLVRASEMVSILRNFISKEHP